MSHLEVLPARAVHKVDYETDRSARVAVVLFRCCEMAYFASHSDAAEFENVMADPAQTVCACLVRVDVLECCGASSPRSTSGQEPFAAAKFGFGRED